MDESQDPLTEAGGLGSGDLKASRISLALIFLLAGCAAWTGCAPAPQEAPTELILAHAAQPVFALLYLADVLGYFADENLAIRFESFTSGRDALTAVVEGKAHLATVYETPVVHRTFQRYDLAVLTTLHNSTRNTALVARRAAGIKSPADLRGKTIAVSRNTNGEFFLEILLTNAGIHRSEVQLVDTPPEKMVAVLAGGRVDAVATWNDHLTNAWRAVGEEESVVFYSDVYTEISVLACLRELVGQKPEALRGLVRAVVRAEDFLQENHDEAVILVGEWLGDPKLTKDTPRWTAIRLEAELDHVLLTILQLEAEWFVERGFYAKPVPDFRATIEPVFLREVRPSAVTIENIVRQ